MAAGAQDGASLVDGRIQLAAYPVGFSRNPDAGMLPELLKIRADRDGDKIVAALPQRLALLLCHPNHTVQSPSTRISLSKGSTPGNSVSTISVPITATLERLFTSFSFSQRPAARS